MRQSKDIGDSEFDLPTLPEPLIPKDRENTAQIAYMGHSSSSKIEWSQTRQPLDVSSQETDVHTLGREPQRKISFSFGRLVGIIVLSISIGVGGAYLLRSFVQRQPQNRLKKNIQKKPTTGNKADER